MLKNKIRNWFRYNHRHQHPALESHQDYMDVLSRLEDLSGVDTEPENHIDDRWPNILKAIGKLTHEQLANVDNRISRLRGDRSAK